MVAMQRYCFKGKRSSRWDAWSEPIMRITWYSLCEEKVTCNIANANYTRLLHAAALATRVFAAWLNCKNIITSKWKRRDHGTQNAFAFCMVLLRARGFYMKLQYIKLHKPYSLLWFRRKPQNYTVLSRIILATISRRAIMHEHHLRDGLSLLRSS